jgi:hypothetical protein
MDADEALVRAQCEEAAKLEENGAPGLIRLSKKAARRLVKETLRQGINMGQAKIELLPTHVRNSTTFLSK